MPLPTYAPVRVSTPASVPPRPPVLSSSRRIGRAPNSPLTVTDVVATVTADAPSTGAAVNLTTPPQVAATTPASVTVTCDPGDVTLDGGDIAILGATAEVTADPHEGIVLIAVGSQGDNFANPFVAAGSGATVTIVTDGFTVEADEPAAVWPLGAFSGDPGTVLNETTWTRYTPNANGTLTITGSTGASGPYQIELFEGSALDNLVRVEVTNNGQLDPVTAAEIPPRISYVVSVGTPVYIRMWPTDSPSNITVTLTLALAADANQQGNLSLTTSTPTFSTSPGVIRADVIGGTPEGNLVFDLIGTSIAFANPPGVALGSAVATYVADTSGNLYGASIALPTVSAGTYTLYVSDVSSALTDSVTIQVQADPIVPPGTIPPDDPIGSIPPSSTVQYWVLKDPAPSGLGAYVFTINPTTMTSPHAPRNVAIEHTVAADGHDIIWEGARRANEWHFQGTVLAQSDYETIVDFAELNRRFWIVDHRERAWVCSIESIGWTKRKAPYNNWAWDYDITALIYDGPTSI